jgi:guanine deaminase
VTTEQGRTSSEDFMRRAIALSHRSIDQGSGPFGAVIVREGIILAEGHNGVAGSFDPTAHAEIVAIRAACRALGRLELRGCDIYTSCEPCPMCLGAIYWARLARVFFANDRFDAARIGFDDALLYGEFALPPEERRLPMIRLLEVEARSAFDAWRLKPDRILY